MKKHKGRLTVKWTNWTFGFWWDPKKLRAWGIDFGPVEYVYAFKPKPRYVAGFDPGHSTSGYGLFQVMGSKTGRIHGHGYLPFHPIINKPPGIPKEVQDQILAPYYKYLREQLWSPETLFRDRIVNEKEGVVEKKIEKTDPE